MMQGKVGPFSSNILVHVLELSKDPESRSRTAERNETRCPRVMPQPSFDDEQHSILHPA